MLRMTRTRRLVATGGVAAAAVMLAAAPALAVANIGPGSTNVTGVKCVQRSMNLVDAAGLTVDGQYGQHTFDAVMTFQSGHGLSADGVVGTNTGNAIIAAVKADINRIHHMGGDASAYTTWMSQCSNKIPHS